MGLSTYGSCLGVGDALTAKIGTVLKCDCVLSSEPMGIIDVDVPG